MEYVENLIFKLILYKSKLKQKKYLVLIQHKSQLKINWNEYF